ncbi:MAG: beta-N-acetylhexosaminidase [Rhodospirillales bacterium]|nr:beta-N-acetylhexosaminidase [Rhodospirillales bacterium]MCW8862121.1 beta-N-acetylhexosaminidase [Rhodospirillales bacterium]MCW8971598.1 beta-N-acetylhexosaminidase [Rhodospirillales bacterium]MCW9001492.1 beta-N-acetylhexosaminidase [Rhodospirillales bacterium]
MSVLRDKAPSAVIFGCSGPVLTGDEARLFADVDALGFILFARNCQNPEQVRRLVDSLRDAVGRDDAPVLIDQEGGRVARLRPPFWRDSPAAARFVDLARKDLRMGAEAARINARLMAAELRELGITVDCAPVLDVPQPDADPIIGDRAHGTTPEMVAHLGRAVCEGLLAGGVTPVLKHIPGHGRARVDSHQALPVVETPEPVLKAVDMAPFATLSSDPLAPALWGMTAHVVYTAFDPQAPATLSERVIGDVIRGAIGFDGFLVSDDLEMKALSGTLASRTRGVLKAGCDAVLHCSGDLEAMRAVAEAIEPLDARAVNRLQQSGAARPDPDDADIGELVERLGTLLEGGAV